ncbi:unnamed protein product [Cunninghamella blakesleeana]
MKLSYMYNIKRTIHQTAIHWNYSRNILRRMKKSELVDLAQQQKLSTIGTKNDIIERILSKPIEIAKKEIAVSENNNKQKEVELNKEEELTTITTTTTTTIATTANTTINNNNNNNKVNETIIDEDDNQFDKQWVEAFDLNKNRFEKMKQDKLMNVTEEKKPSIFSQQDTVSSSFSSINETSSLKSKIAVTLIDSKEDQEMIFDDPEINQQWVKAFDQRVKHRAVVKPRNISNSENDLNEKITIHQQNINNLNNNNNNNTRHQQQTNNIHSSDKTEKKEQLNSNNNDNSNNNTNNNNVFINSIIGSSLLYWYIRGEDGFYSIISYFSS